MAGFGYEIDNKPGAFVTLRDIYLSVAGSTLKLRENSAPPLKNTGPSVVKLKYRSRSFPAQLKYSFS